MDFYIYCDRCGESYYDEFHSSMNMKLCSACKKHYDETKKAKRILDFDNANGINRFNWNKEDTK